MLQLCEDGVKKKYGVISEMAMTPTVEYYNVNTAAWDFIGNNLYFLSSAE